jgi:type IV pilus assembly protein PilN
MPRINLLPVRAAQRVDSARNEIGIIGLLLVLTLAGLYTWYSRMAGDISDVETKIADAKAEIAKVEKKVTQVDDFKKKAVVLERKLEVIDRLKRQKIGPAKMLSDLADIATRQRKVWLTSFEQKENTLVMQGGAMEQENISEFQIALEQQSKFFQNVTLTLVNASKDGAVPFFQWTITCTANYAAG